MKKQEEKPVEKTEQVDPNQMEIPFPEVKEKIDWEALEKQSEKESPYDPKDKNESRYHR